jgi:hypothetical protein
MTTKVVGVESFFRLLLHHPLEGTIVKIELGKLVLGIKAVAEAGIFFFRCDGFIKVKHV